MECIVVGAASPCYYSTTTATAHVQEPILLTANETVITHCAIATSPTVLLRQQWPKGGK